MAIKSVWIEEDCIACGTCEGRGYSGWDNLFS